MSHAPVNEVASHELATGIPWPAPFLPNVVVGLAVLTDRLINAAIAGDAT